MIKYNRDRQQEFINQMIETLGIGIAIIDRRSKGRSCKRKS